MSRCNNLWDLEGQRLALIPRHHTRLLKEEYSIIKNNEMPDTATRVFINHL